MALRLVGMIALLAAAAGAHHPFSAIYDSSNMTTLTGVVVRLEWSNPHVVLVLDVARPGGSAERWAVEGYPPNTVSRNAESFGWSRDSFRPGMRVTMTGWPARDAPARVMSGREVTFEDGSKGAFGPAPSDGWQCAGPCPDFLTTLLEHTK